MSLGDFSLNFFNPCFVASTFYTAAVTQENMADPVTITISGATLALLGERLFAYFVTPHLRTKAEAVARAGNTAGEQDPAYWKQEFRASQIEVNKLQVMPILESLGRAQEKQSAILESMAKTMEGVATMVEARGSRRRN
jgi:hypothetical protein